ncbi:PREDICTED: alpha-ketoglutarate-dependent dioxygenase alkB homolog 4 [Dinoponera quadriceps]|uniref:Alpha-ketoglutarate-dependent dioxygenase alkB homolog 4 n=1 Tax=Dinoponera quadriceps TaxID=609295 RepID=A0A6P3XPY4_DINQU|nr:PREDICTED: alpha-ketoglutarate-dependent dioxygenase alkB homolog 4 [Dinoponera quadriceps]
MQTVRPCGCKGVRSCLICEEEYKIIRKEETTSILQKSKSYVYCPYCDKLSPGWDVDEYKKHPYHDGNSIDYPGVYIKLDFLNEDEAKGLMKALDHLPWQASQSGRRKQNFGPKCNFKKRKLQLGTFDGFPKTTQFVQTKFGQVPLLRDFNTVEQCSLEYDPVRGASIDPHIDDCWIWGERIVTVNVLGDSVLTMTPYRGQINRYNLDCVPNYNSSVLKDDVCNNTQAAHIDDDVVVRLPMPAGSLMILYGPARYKWEHSVLREDVVSRRVCLAYRELTPPYLENGENREEASEILRQATFFW